MGRRVFITTTLALGKPKFSVALVKRRLWLSGPGNTASFASVLSDEDYFEENLTCLP